MHIFLLLFSFAFWLLRILKVHNRYPKIRGGLHFLCHSVCHLPSGKDENVAPSQHFNSRLNPGCPLACIGIIQKLWEEQVRGIGNAAIFQDLFTDPLRKPYVSQHLCTGVRMKRGAYKNQLLHIAYLLSLVLRTYPLH